MNIGDALLKLANFGLRPFGAGVITHAAAASKPWDKQFLSWIAEAREKGVDPNDIADQQWSNPQAYLETYCYPYVKPEHVVLELGPGTGRTARHLIKRCAKLLLVDYSQAVCDWLQEYMKGRGEFEVHHAGDSTLPDIPDNSINVVWADGVFEHIDLEDFYRYFKTFCRVLHPEGIMIINIDTLMTDDGIDWFISQLPKQGRGIFRFYHPDMISRLADHVGFKLESKTDHVIRGEVSRHCFMTFRRIQCS